MLGKDWQCIDLRKCQIITGPKDSAVFILMQDRSDEDKQPKEIKLWAPNICQRNLWVRKLQKAKKRDFGFHAQSCETAEEQLNDTDVSIAPALVDRSYSDHQHGGIIRLQG